MALLGFITIDGISYDPFIRGWLTVIVGVAVLMGSVYLLLATNSGARTGLLIALTGLFGWMTIMGVIWWVYGIGLKGPAPAWEVTEINRGDLALAAFDEAQDLGVALDERLATEDESLQRLAEVAEERGVPEELGGWDEMLLTNAKRGEAQAVTDAYLVESGSFATANEYLPVAAFEIGGKERRASNAIGDRVIGKLRSIFVQPFNPPHYAVIMVQPVEERTLVSRPGQAPPTRVVDEDQPVLSVILVRNLGSLRLPPAMVTLGSAVLFGLFAWMLHSRDKREAANRASLVPLYSTDRGS
ncbi:MAG: hypothetical protein GEV08_15955 [Acidimicrobiia bacterium]|nr:hypothetical protein [Acidimicrobiia bacterium]